MDYGDIDNAYFAINRCLSPGMIADNLLESLEAVIGYADDCYVGHCEDVGQVVIQEITEIENNIKETAWKFIEKNILPYTSLDYETVKEDYNKIMDS